MRTKKTEKTAVELFCEGLVKDGKEFVVLIGDAKKGTLQVNSNLHGHTQHLALMIDDLVKKHSEIRSALFGLTLNEMAGDVLKGLKNVGNNKRATKRAKTQVAKKTTTKKAKNSSRKTSKK